MNNSLKLNILAFLFLLISNVSAFAQKDSIDILQYVKDSFTKYGIDDVRITLADNEGNVIDTLRTEEGGGTHHPRIWWTKVARKPQTFLVKAEHDDYEPVTMKVELLHPGRLESYTFPDLEMKRMRSRELDEVVVTATKVQLAYRGDTLVVDATAFRLPEGSMLDALVASVPGAELNDDGVIYMNGRKVDYLTLNGKDFFKGNNRMMLDNLPFYVVNKLQFYEKTVKRSEMLRPNTGEKDYVMDVVLKQEYAIGYTANAEIGAGTSDRWLARLFGLRYTDNSRLTVFVNANNVNEAQRPGRNGGWGSLKVPNGERSTKIASAEFMVDDKNNRFMEQVEGTLHWSDMHDEALTSKESFYTNSHSYGRSENKSQLNYFNASVANKLELKRMGLTFNTNVNRVKRDNNGMFRSATFMSDPAPFGTCVQLLDSIFTNPVNSLLEDININKVLDQSLSNTKTWNAGQTITWDKDLPWGDGLMLSANGNCGKRNQHGFNRYELYYANPTYVNDIRDKYNYYFNQKYSYNFEAAYYLNLLNRWGVFYSYEFEQQYANTASSLYRLDWVGNDEMFGILSSNMDFIKAMDFGNSYESRYMTKLHTNRIGLNHTELKNNRNWYLRLSADIHYKTESINYQRNSQLYTKRQHTCFLTPNLLFENYAPNLRYYKIAYESNVTTPNLVQMLDVKDTSDPLARTEGNPDLKKSYKHYIELLTSKQYPGNAHFYNLKLAVTIWDNLIANGFTFNPQNGVYVYKPENVKGNWQAELSSNHRTFLCKNKRFHLDGIARLGYIRNVDLAAQEGYDYSRKSTVDHYTARERVKVEYKRNSLRIDLTGEMSWNHLYRKQISDKENYIDFNYGVSGQYTFPLNIQLSTEMKVYCRRGYEEPAMNRNDIVWNASLARPFCKGRFLARLEAYDILHQLSSTNYVVNGQGRTETINLTLPNYLMLHLSYQFNKNPKKKN